MPAYEHLNPDEFGSVLEGPNGHQSRKPGLFGDASNELRTALQSDAGREREDKLVEYHPRTTMLAALAVHDSLGADDEALFYAQEHWETRMN